MSSRNPVAHGVFKDVQEAEHYDRESRLWMRNVVEDFASAAERWGVASGKVLDIGSGSGLVSIKFARMLHGVQVTGLDLSDPVLEMARNNAESSGLADRVSFEKGDAEGLPFEDATFDMVISLSTLHLLDNPVRMLDDIQRVIKPGGKFYIRDYRRTWMAAFSIHIRACYTPSELKSLLSQSKLQDWRVRGGLFWLSVFSADRSSKPGSRSAKGEIAARR